jgi:hypothetical protein
MTADPSIDAARFLHEQLASASPDLLREMLATFIGATPSDLGSAAPPMPTADRTAGDVAVCWPRAHRTC